MKSIRLFSIPRLQASLRLAAAFSAAALLPFTASAGIDFELVLWHGYSFYYGDASLSASSPAPDTYHRVESPNALIWQNTGTDNSGSSATLSLTNDLGVLLNEITNGLWNLTLNVGTATQQQYAFSIDLSGVNTGLFGNAVITSPADLSTIATNPPLIQWTGPGQLPSININVSLDGPPYTFHDGTSLPGTATSWTPSVVIPTGDQSIFLNYRSNMYAGATFSTPTNLVGGAPLPGWTANADISTYTFSTFTVPGSGSEFDVAVESPGLSWTTGGDSGGWFVQSNEVDVGTTSLQSGPVGDFEISWIETTVMGPGTLQFDWNLLADYDDFFDLSVSNSTGEYGELGVAGYAGGSWDFYEVYLEPGENKLRWTFWNDDLSGGDLDAAFLDLVVLSNTPAYEVELDLNIQRITSGTNSYYTMFPSLFNEYPPPVTSFEVESPTRMSYGDTSGSSSVHYPTLQALINEIEAGSWTLLFNPGAPTFAEYTFDVFVNSLTTNTIPPVLILDPVDGATGVATNTDYLFLGPPDYDSLSVQVRDVEANSTLGHASLPPSSTTWTNGPGLPVGTNTFSATYTSNNYPGLSISWPEDVNFNPLSYWDSTVRISARGTSRFVAGSGFVPMAVTLLPPKLVGGNLELAFISQSGATHQVEYTTNLVTGPWMPATNFPGSGSTNQVMLPTTDPEAFFRIETQ